MRTRDAVYIVIVRIARGLMRTVRRMEVEAEQWPRLPIPNRKKEAPPKGRFREFDNQPA
jgi:hypothetical protein